MSNQDLEIPFSLIDEWEAGLFTEGSCVTFWKVAKWGYDQAKSKEGDEPDL